MKTYHLEEFCLRKDMPLHVMMNSCDRAWLEPDHDHDYIEVIYYVSGVGCMTLNGQKHPILPGDVYVLLPRMVHSFQTVKKLKYYNLMFHWSAFSELELKSFQEHRNFSVFFQPDREGSQCYHFPFSHTRKIEQLLSGAYECISLQRPGFAAMLRGYVLLLMNEVIALQQNFSQLRPSGDHTIRMMSNSIDFINENFATSITLRELARRNNVSANHFSRFFKAQTGMTLKEYVNTVRVFEACRLLAAPQYRTLSIAEIGAGCGFCSPAYLAEVFQKVMSMLPSAARFTGRITSSKTSSGCIGGISSRSMCRPRATLTFRRSGCGSVRFFASGRFTGR